MGFWVRNIIFGCILVSLAIYFLLNQDLMMSFTDAPAKSPSTTEAVKTDDVVAPTPTPAAKPTKKQPPIRQLRVYQPFTRILMPRISVKMVP